MSDAPATSPTSSTLAQPVTPAATVTNKIFVAGLGEGDGKEEIRQLFSFYGEVLEVMVDGTCATVTFKEERLVEEMEQMREIMLGCRKLNIARVLEEHVDIPITDAPFYQGVMMPAPKPPQSGDTMLSSSYPTYQPAYPYPVWYQQPNQYYDPAISDCGPVQSHQPYQTSGQTSSSYHPALSSTSSVAKPSTANKSVFTFDTMATQLDHQTNQSHTLTNTNCCHICSTPAVHGVAPLAIHQVSGHPPYYGHQLQPLTPMTPSLNTRYLLPPTPTPTNLPPMTPAYYLPPSPAPSYMMYQAAHPAGQNATSLPYTSQPPPLPFTNLKPTGNDAVQEDININRQNVTFFTSPFKRFTKFRGTPTLARFPLRAAPISQAYKGRGSGGSGGSSSWYQQGDRWGHRSGWEGDHGYQQGYQWDQMSGGESDQGYLQGDRWGHRSGGEGYQQGHRCGHKSGEDEDQGYQQGDRWGQKSVKEVDPQASDILRDCKGTQETESSAL